MTVMNKIADEQSVYIIAEAGVNHNGQLDLAKQLIDVAAANGADAVKFQTFTADRLVTPDAPKASYQEETTDEQSQHEMLKRYELSKSDHERLIEHCDRRDITFLSTPFDAESATLLDELDLQAIKLGSGELTNHPLLNHVAEIGKPILMSTGMATMDEVRDALKTIRATNSAVPIALLHCTSTYPAEIKDVNLRAMQSMIDEFDVPVGYSDHTTAVETPGLAIAAGAAFVEKHFTIDKTLPGPDHRASLEPDELAEAVDLARVATTARGTPVKEPTDAERENRETIRKSLHAATRIEMGERLTRDRIAIKRPATGISPTQYDAVLGRRVAAALKPGDPITREAVDLSE